MAERLDRANLDGHSLCSARQPATSEVLSQTSEVAERLDRANLDGHSLCSARQPATSEVLSQTSEVAERLDRANPDGHSLCSARQPATSEVFLPIFKRILRQPHGLRHDAIGTGYGQSAQGAAG